MITAIYKIGKAVSQNQEPIDCLLKSVKINKKDKKGNVVKNYILKIIFDLVSNKILINSDNLIVYDPERSLKRFAYCGNNGGREKQFYLTRELKSSGFLLGKTFKDLLDKIKSEDTKNYKDNRLYQLVSKIVQGPLYDTEKMAVNFNQIESVKEDYMNFKSPQLINTLVSTDYNEKIILATPSVIIEDNEEINLAEMKEYRDIVSSKLKRKPKKSKKVAYKFCYLCKKAKASSSDNLKDIKIMKLFTTTAINSSSGIYNKHYDKNYSVCSDCLQKLLAAEGFIKNNMGLRIAGTPTYLIPNLFSLTDEFTPKYFKKIHGKIELAFNEGKFNEFIESVEDEIDEEEADFSLDFLSYETDGKYFKVLNYINEVPKFYFTQLKIGRAHV